MDLTSLASTNSLTAPVHGRRDMRCATTSGKRDVASYGKAGTAAAEELAVDATPFGHYQLQKLIGRGGMGEVYRAYDTKTDRIVALKVLPHHLAEDATFQRRVRRGSQAAAGPHHPPAGPIPRYR